MPERETVEPFGDFDFDLARAVLEQLVEAFNALPAGALDPPTLSRMKKGQGVYQLFLGGELHYVGKAGNLPQRLSRHYRELSARLNLDVSTLCFKALYIHQNWTTWTTENALIRHFSPLTPSLWNTSGFGSNDPGHNREDTAEDDTFNNDYPINPDITCIWIGRRTAKAWDILSELKENLPYLLRFHKVTNKFKRQIDHEAQNQLKLTDITIPRDGMTVREVMIEIARQLGAGWQATQFKGRLILYKERVEYNYGNVLYRAGV
ncbi:MAG: Eco29kI family restriction endonuclease [Tepidisphaeraceae bacterium]|jgi:hypothetical protein